nr:diguanylate cyclase [uncultured Flavobacterium sp.]
MVNTKNNNLVNSDKNLSFQNKEREKSAAELVIANKEMAFQNKEKGKRAAELVIANKEMAFQNKEKGKRAAELVIANKELTFQNKEKGKRAAELVIANKELTFQNKEKEKRAAELVIANKELAYQNQEKEKRTEELIAANAELKKAEEYQKEYILGLEKMMFMTSHKVRLDIANILGISNLLDHATNSPEEHKQFVDYIRKSAISLDVFTKELTFFIFDLEQKGRNKNFIKPTDL